MHSFFIFPVLLPSSHQLSLVYLNSLLFLHIYSIYRGLFYTFYVFIYIYIVCSCVFFYKKSLQKVNGFARLLRVFVISFSLLHSSAIELHSYFLFEFTRFRQSFLQSILFLYNDIQSIMEIYSLNIVLFICLYLYCIDCVCVVLFIFQVLYIYIFIFIRYENLSSIYSKYIYLCKRIVAMYKV